MVRSIMSHADLPNSFWGHALLTVAYTLNCVPSKKAEKTPYEIWSGKKPHMSYMKIWGCEVYVKRQISTKLEPKSEKCLFMGYHKETRGYYFYNPSKTKVFVTGTGVFLEKYFISIGISGRKVELEEIKESQSIDTPMEELEQETQVLVEEQSAQVEQDQCSSGRIHHLPERYGYLITDQGDALVMDQDESVTYQETITGESTYILGIKIYRDKSQKLLGLSQSTYIDKVPRRFNMHDSKKGFIPMQHGSCLSKTQSPSTKEERDRMNKIPYASVIGSIMYAVLCTRPDVSYALSVTSRYQSDPSDAHWVAVKNILKYLRRTKDSFLIYVGQ
ncbi:hypothetical protein KIW84_012653 [Lathyrus oleraceus]|uniref:Retroviral polymerase SH3-like domain-containing protein n=1 Tax=Pisum sativum TaxID=3888 RepID=A0A9D5GWN9_PEA|nr:hypothetical protein KIW84_012653 [Pisum sativum]